MLTTYYAGRGQELQKQRTLGPNVRPARISRGTAVAQTIIDRVISLTFTVRDTGNYDRLDVVMLVVNRFECKLSARSDGRWRYVSLAALQPLHANDGLVITRRRIYR